MPEDEKEWMELDLQVNVEVRVPKGMSKADVVKALDICSTDSRVSVDFTDIQKWY